MAVIPETAPAPESGPPRWRGWLTPWRSPADQPGWARPALLALADEESRRGGARRIVLHAQTYARELYEQAGYRPRGRVFWEASIEHIAMEKMLD